MRNSFFTWLFIIGVIVVIFFAVNYQGGKNAVPLSDIFPEEETRPVDIEYEFVSDDGQQREEGKEVVQAPAPKTSQVEPVEKPKTQVIAHPQEVKEEKVVTEKIPYTIQVASFKEKDKAVLKEKELKAQNFSAFIAPRDLGTKGTWYRVYVGKFNSVADAKKRLIEVKKKHPASFIISPR